MDWGTHLVLADRLLRATGLDPAAAIYSVVPVIDEKPAHFHRVYAHILDNFPAFLDAAVDLLGGVSIADPPAEEIQARAAARAQGLRLEADGRNRVDVDRRAYAHERIGEMAARLIGHAREALRQVPEPPASRISVDRVSAGVSLLSHIYFDLWNNPVQAFLPASSFCSGMWDFWDRIDYMRFRGEFFRDQSIERFRGAMIDHPLWKPHVDPVALLHAMVVRIGRHGQPAIPLPVVRDGSRAYLRYLGLHDEPDAGLADPFLDRLEEAISGHVVERFART